MKSSSLNSLLARSLLAVLALAGMPFTGAATNYFYDTTTTGTWATGGSWSDNLYLGGITGTPPGANDKAFFNQFGITAASTTVNLDADTSVGGITFYNTSTATIIQSPTSHNNLNIGSGGVYINTNAAAVSFGDAGFANYIGYIGLDVGNQSWVNNASTTFTLNSNVKSVNANRALTIGGTGATTFTIGLQNGSFSTSLIKDGSGILTFTDATTGTGAKFTFNGGLTLNAGKVLLNSTASSASGFADIIGESPLTMGGGALVATWANTVTSLSNQQTVNGTTLNPGASTVGANNSQGTASATKNAIVNLGAITRNAGSTVNFSATGNASAADKIYVASSSWTAGVAGTIVSDSGVTYATAVGSTTANASPSSASDNWAGTDAGNKICNSAYAATYTASTASTLTLNADINSATDTTLAANATPTSLRFSHASARTITATGYTLTTGGILVSSAVGANKSTITGGTLRSAATASGKDLVIINNDASSYLDLSGTTIADSTAGATGLTQSGAGGLALGTANTYSGSTYLNGGYVSISTDGTGSSNPLGAYPGSAVPGAIYLNGGIFNATAGFIIGANRGITLGGNGGTINSASSSTLTINSIITSATGATSPQGYDLLGINNGSTLGTVTLANANTFTGGIKINSGELKLNASPAGTLNSTAGSENTVDMNQAGSAAASALAGAGSLLTLNGNSVVIGDLKGSGTGAAFPAVVQNANASGATLTVGNSQNLSGSTFNGVIQDGTGGGALALVKTGLGTLTLSPSIVRACSWTAAAGSGVTVTVTLTSGDTSYLQVGTAFSGITGGSTIASITDSTHFTFTSTAAVTASSGNVTFTQRLNTYTGGTIVKNGTLTVGSTGLPYNSALTLGDSVNNTPGLLNLSGSQTLSTLNSAGTAGLNNLVRAGASAYGLTLTGGNQTFNGTFGSAADAMNLTYSGSGTLSLGGRINYTGATTIGAGSTIKLTDVNVLGISGNATTTFKNQNTAGTYTLQYAAGATLNAAAALNLNVNATPATTFILSLDGYSQTLSSLILGQKNIINVTTTGGTSTLTVTGNTAIGSGNNASISVTNAPMGVSMSLNTVTPTTTTAGSGTQTLVLDGTSTGNQISGVISDATGTYAAPTAITKQNTSTWTLAGTNTYTGITTVSGGTLKIVKTNSLYNADNTKWNPTYIAVASGATLALNVGGTGEFDSTMLTTFLDGTHMGLSTTTTGFKTGSILALDTSNAGGSFTLGAFGNLGSGNVNGLTKVGTGALVLNGANTYTGPTYIYGGTLKLTGGSLGNTAITNFGGTLAIQPGGNTTINIGSTATASAGANLNLGSGTFDMTDGAVSTCNIQQSSSFTTPALTVSNNATFKFNLGNSSADQLILVNGSGYGVASVSGTVNVTIDTTGATSLSVGTYPLITAASGLTAGSPAPAWQFTGGGTAEHVTVNGTVYNLKLQATDTAINLTVENTYSVTYNGNLNDGGSVPTDTTAYNNGQTVTVLGNTGGLTKSGSVFNGWNTAADGSGLPTGSTYLAGNTFTASANVTLYAQWQGASGTIYTSGSPSAMTTTYGTASAPTSFSVSGSGLDNNGIVVTAPSGFEVSLASGGVYSGSVTVGAGSGTVSSTPVYVRLKASNAIGSYSGNLQCQNALASLVNVAIPSSTVSQAPLNLTATSAQSKMYDGTTTATVNGTLIGVLGGDVGNVSLSTSDNFPVATANNTTPQTWTPNWTLTGSAAAKYQITNSPLPTVTASILSAGIWTNTVSGNWGAAANWTNNLIATNVNNTADFSQVNINSDTTVTLETAKTIGNLIFGDTDTSSPAGWAITGANTLSLAGTTPTVTVNALGTGKSATIGTVVAGSSGLTKAGSGTLALNNANSYTGGTTLNAGTVSIGNANALGTSGTIDFSSGSTLQWGSGITADLSARLKIEDGVTATLDTGNNTVVAAAALTVGSSGTGALIKQGSGTLTLSGANTFSGGVTLANGQLNINNAGSGGTSSAIGTGTLTINGGTIDNTSGADLGLSTANPITMAGDFTYTGTKSLAFGGGGVTLTGGTRTLTVNGSSTYLALAGPIGDGGNHYGLTKGGSSTSTLYFLANNTLSGPITNNAGTLSIGNGGTAGDMGSSPSVTLNAGTLQFARTTDYTYNGTITGASAGTVIRLATSPGQLSLGTVSGISTLNDSYASGVANNKPLLLNQSGPGLTIATVTGASGSFIQFAGDGTGSTTMTSVPATAGQLLDVESGTVTLGYGGSQHVKSSIKVGGGTLTLGSSADRFAPDAGGTPAQTLSISGSGTFTIPGTTGFGARLGGYNGPGGSGGASFTGTQSGGTFNVLHGTSQQSFGLGANAASAGTVCQYTLSGGLLNIIGTGANGYLEIGADTTGNCTSSFTLSGGKLIVSSTIQGYQAYTSPGPIQNFVFTGGILAANNINMTKLITSGNITANPGTLNNSGTGTLAPGDLGYPGKTTITGGYSDNVNATNAFDLGGGTAASVFQDGTSNSYDNVSITGTAILAGNLVVNLLNNFDPSGQSFTILTAGTLSSASFANVVNGRVAVANRPGMSFRVTVTTGASGTVVLDNYASLVWNGNLGSDWNTASNWKDSSGNATTYADPAAVLFDDTASTASVTLNSTVNPTNVSFNNATLSYTVSGTGKISGSATVNKSGTGTATLGTANDYTGLTTVSKGVLLITNASALGSVTAGTVVASGAALQLSNNITTLAEPLTLNGTGVAADGALRSTSGNNNYTGPITITTSSGCRIAADAGTLTLSSATPLIGGNVLYLSGAGNVVVNSPMQITNNNALNISSGSGGSVTLNASNSFIAGVILNSGALLNIGNSNALGTNAFVIGGNGSFDNSSGSPMVISNALTISGGSPTFVGTSDLTNTGPVTISVANRTVTVTAGNLTFAGGVAPDATPTRVLTKAGNGTLTLSPASTHTGGTTISAGTLAIGDNGSLGSGTLTLGGGTLQSSGGTRTLANNALLTASSAIGGADQVLINGTFTESGGSRTLTLNNSALTTLAGNVYFSDDNSTAGRGLTIAGAGNLLVSAPIANNNAGNTKAASLTISGPGTVTLANANSYSGATTISGGTLALSGSGAIASTNIVVAGGATFDVSALFSTFALSGSQPQTLTNSGAGTAIITGNLDATAGALGLAYASGTPSFRVNNTFTLASGTAFTVNNTGAKLTHGGYKLISKSGSGAVGGTLPSSFTVAGGGAATGAAIANHLWLNNGELYLVVSNNAPVAQPITMGAIAGVTATLKIMGGKFAPVDPDGDAMTLTLPSSTSVNGVTLTTDGTSVSYTPAANAADGTDSFTYTVSDPYGATVTQTVTVNVQSGGSVGQKVTINWNNGQPQMTFWGIPGTSYTVQFSTDLVNWTDLAPSVTANTSQPLGQINFTDSNAPSSGTGYYRLKP